MDNFRGLLSIRKMDKLSNARIRELCEMMKELMKVFSGVPAMIGLPQLLKGLLKGYM